MFDGVVASRAVGDTQVAPRCGDCSPALGGRLSGEVVHRSAHGQAPDAVPSSPLHVTSMNCRCIRQRYELSGRRFGGVPLTRAGRRLSTAGQRRRTPNVQVGAVGSRRSISGQRVRRQLRRRWTCRRSSNRSRGLSGSDVSAPTRRGDRIRGDGSSRGERPAKRRRGDDVDRAANEPRGDATGDTPPAKSPWIRFGLQPAMRARFQAAPRLWRGCRPQSTPADLANV